MAVRHAILFMAGLLVSANCAFAGDSRPSLTPIDIPPGTTNEADRTSLRSSLISSNRWHDWHQSVSSNVVGAAEYIDRYFGDDRLDEESNGTRLRLTLGVRFQEYEEVDFIHRASIRLSLPNLTERLQLVFNEWWDGDEEDGVDPVMRSEEDVRTTAGVRYNVQAKKRTKVDADAGARIGSPSQVYLRLRGSWASDVTERVQLRLIESIRWFSADGFISTTEMQWNYRLDPDWLFRSSSQLVWSEEDDGVRPVQIVSLYQTISKHRAIRYELLGTWPETPHTDEATYQATVTFRRLIHSNWLFMEIKPGVEFKQERDYTPQPLIAIQWEILFGNLP